MESNTVLNLLFTLIAVNKDLEYKFTSERERSIAWYNFPGKSSYYFAVTFWKYQFCLIKTFNVSEAPQGIMNILIILGCLGQDGLIRFFLLGLS